MAYNSDKFEGYCFIKQVKGKNVVGHILNLIEWDSEKNRGFCVTTLGKNLTPNKRNTTTEFVDYTAVIGSERDVQLEILIRERFK